MNKLFILSILVVAALAAQKTNAACEKDLKMKKDCKQCPFAKKDTTKCKNAVKGGNLVCVTLKKCYADVKAADDKAAKAAAKKIADKYSKFCPTDKAKCVDQSANCRSWAARKPSECTANPDWMLPQCAQSCCPLCTGKNTLKNTGSCPPKGRSDLCVKNTNSQCHAWATQKKNQCTENKKWMRSNCMQSCCKICATDKDKCPTVKDTCKNKFAKPNAKKGNTKCADWAKNGECKVNSNWMNSNCAKECCPVCAPKAPGQATIVTQQPILRQQPVYQQPVLRQQPVIQQPVLRQQPVLQQPVLRQQPVIQQPVLQQPVLRQQPVIQQPVIQQPVYRQQQVLPSVRQQPVQFGGYFGR